MASRRPLRIGYVPEHFSTPLHFAFTHYGLDCTLVPFPSGTGHMISWLEADQLDIGIGLTEGWIAGLGKKQAEKENVAYKMVGTYVETPLCWAISTGVNRDDLTKVGQLKGKKIGVSRIGSGSYVMAFVLADQEGWLDPANGSAEDAPILEFLPLQSFDKLREGVNSSEADYFMWEHFTSKRYYDNGSIKKIGEIYTPWPSWHLVARNVLVNDPRLGDLFKKLNQGIQHFKENQEEAVKYISTDLDYSAEDARDWLKTVKFAKDVKGVRTSVLEETVKVLEKAGVLGSVNVGEMVGFEKEV